jgi:hypothetical protein
MKWWGEVGRECGEYGDSSLGMFGREYDATAIVDDSRVLLRGVSISSNSRERAGYRYVACGKQLTTRHLEELPCGYSVDLSKTAGLNWFISNIRIRTK